MQPLPGHPHRVINQFRHAPGADDRAGPHPGGRGRNQQRDPAPGSGELKETMDPSMVPSISRGQPPAWLQQHRKQKSAGEEGGAATTIPGFAAVPMGEGDWRSLAPNGHALDQVMGIANAGSEAQAALAALRPLLPSQLRSPSPPPPPPPPQQLYAESPLPPRALRPLLSRSPPPHSDYGLHEHYSGDGNAGGAREMEECDVADAASVLDALEMIGHGACGGGVPVLGLEMAEMFSHDEDPPSNEWGQLLPNQQAQQHHF